MLATGFIIASLFASIVNGLARHSKRQSSNIIPLNLTQISSFKPYTFFASAAYCLPSTTSKWTCGGMSLIMWFQDWTIDRPSVCGMKNKLIALQTRTSFQKHREATVALCNSVGVIVAFGIPHSHEWWSDSAVCDEGYVGFSPSQETVIVAHQGTTLSELFVRFYVVT